MIEILRDTESEHIYLVGDIIDGWRLKRSWYWPQAHNDVVQKLLRKARKGTILTFVPGNHDEGFRDFIGVEFGRIRIVDEVIHEMKDGRRFLITHGDKFDVVVSYAKWLALIGDYAYGAALALNVWFNFARRKLGFGYWSLSSYLKYRVKNAVAFIGDYEQALVAEARRRDVHGVICGHIHHAAMHEVDGIVYCNDGDWVESCTALVEHPDGALEIIDWLAERKKALPVAA